MESTQLQHCRQRLYCRLPLLGGWLRRRAVTSLARDGSAEAARLLEEAVVECPEEDLRLAAFEALRDLAADTNVPAQEALCRLVMHHDHPLAREEALATGYAPHEETQRALFYFLTEQWPQYESLDFDHNFLRAAYLAADAALQRRIAARARQAGRVEWVGVAAGGRQGRRLGEMTDAEWKTVLTVLADKGRWEEVWRMAQEAPPRWSARLLRRLREASWRPGRDQEQGFAELTRLAEHWQDQDFSPFLHCRQSLTGHRDEVRCLAISRSGRWLASGSGDRTIRLWELPEGKALKTLARHTAAVTCLAISPNRHMLAGGGKDNNVWLWSLPSGRTLGLLQGHRRSIMCLAITPNSRVLASGGLDGIIQLWGIPHGEALKTLDGHGDAIQSLVISPDGRFLASASADCTVRLWALPEGQPLKTLTGHRAEQQDAVLCLAVSTDGKLLASAGTDGDLLLWSLPDGQALGTLEGHAGPANCLALQPQGQVLASGGSDQSIHLWSVPGRESLERFEAHSGAVTALAFSPDGRMLASASGQGFGHDHSVRLWSVPEGRWLNTLYGHTRYVTCLAMSPDGDVLASGSGDGTVRLWSSPLARLSRLPVAKTTLKDLAWVEQALRKEGLSEAEKKGLEFLAALLRWRRRQDIIVDEARPRLLEIGEFDIEIEG